MYLRCSVGAWLAAIRTAERLSMKCGVGIVSFLGVSSNSLRSQVMCRGGSVADIYSDSVVERETTFCLRECHEIGVVFQQCTLPVMEFLSFPLAKSASLKTESDGGWFWLESLLLYRSR